MNALFQKYLPTYAPTSAPSVFLIGDFRKDLDDEKCLMAAIMFHIWGVIRLVGVIGNLTPAVTRARAARGIVNLFDSSIPVGIGCPVNTDVKVKPYETDEKLLAPEGELAAGDALLLTCVQQYPELIIVCNSGLTDMAEFLQDHAYLAGNIGLISFMGEVDGDKVAGGVLAPGNAQNVNFDRPSAELLFQQVQELKIPFQVLSRHTAGADKMPLAIFAEFRDTGTELGQSLYKRNNPALLNLWKAASSAADSQERKEFGGLPPDRNRDWFVKAFLGGTDPGSENLPDVTGNPEPYFAKYNEYDAFNLFAALFGDELFDSVDVCGAKVIGLTPAQHGIKSPGNVSGLLHDLLMEAFKLLK